MGAPWRTPRAARTGSTDGIRPTTLPIISADPLPAGARLADESPSPTLVRYAFDWPAAVGQALINADGSYRPYQITFTASGGALAVAPDIVAPCDGLVLATKEICQP